MAQKTDIKTQILQLHKYYNLALSYPDSNIYKEKFFDSFPDDFSTYNGIYGNMPLYTQEEWHAIFDTLDLEYYQHIDLFYSISNLIHDSTFYRKMINIALNGYWDSDGVGIFQEKLLIKIFDNIEMSLYILNTLSTKECLSVYHFLFDGPHPDHPWNREMYKKLYQQILLRDKKQAQLLKQSYSKLLKEDHCSGH